MALACKSRHYHHHHHHRHHHFSSISLQLLILYIFFFLLCVYCVHMHGWMNELEFFSSVHQDGRESHQEKRHFVGDGGGRGPCHVTVLYIVQKTDDKRRRKKVAISWQWWHATYKIVLQHNCFSKSISHRYSVHSLKSRERGRASSQPLFLLLTFFTETWT